MAVSSRFLEYVVEQLGGLPAVRSNRMFNGVGLYSQEVFFAVLHEDTLYFKTDDSNIAGYRERRMAQFMPFKDRPATALGYHQVPADILEDPESLVEWARAAVRVAAAKALSREKKSAARKSSANTAKKAAKRTAKKPAKKPAKKAARKSSRATQAPRARRKPARR